MLNVTLKIPLSTLNFAGFFERYDPSATWIEMLHEAFDGASLARAAIALPGRARRNEGKR